MQVTCVTETLDSLAVPSAFVSRLSLSSVNFIFTMITSRIFFILAVSLVPFCNGRREDTGQKPLADSGVPPEPRRVSLAIDHLEYFIQQKMKKWHVPGLAIGVGGGGGAGGGGRRAHGPEHAGALE